MKDCAKRMFFGKAHKFEPRYNLVEPKIFKRITSISNLNKLSDHFERHYVCDVCVYCGQISINGLEADKCQS